MGAVAVVGLPLAMAVDRRGADVRPVRLAIDAWEWPVAAAPSPSLARRLGAAAAWLRGQPDIRDAVAGLVSLVVWSEVPNPPQALVDEALALEPAADAVAQHRIAVRWDGADLDAVAEAAGWDPAGLVAAMTGTVFTVGAVGFTPGFPYLLGLSPDLHLPRRAEPRVRVSAGSVAVAGGLAGIYPAATPGGWHLLGRTDPARLPDFAVGDGVRFVALPPDAASHTPPPGGPRP